MTYAAGSATCANHGNASWREQRSEGVPRQAVHARLPGNRGRIRRRGQCDVHDAATDMPLGDKPGIGEHPQHESVAGQGVRNEPLDPAVACEHDQLLEQQRADPPSVLRVVDKDCHLSLIRRGPLVRRHSDDLVPRLGDKDHVAIGLLLCDQPLRVRGRRGPVGRKEPQVEVVVRDPLVQRSQRRTVLRTCSPDADNTAIGRQRLIVDGSGRVAHDAAAS